MFIVLKELTSESRPGLCWEPQSSLAQESHVLERLGDLAPLLSQHGGAGENLVGLMLARAEWV